MRKKHILLLQEISRSIPKEMVSRLLVETKISPNLEKAVKKFINGQKIQKYMEDRWKGKEQELKHLYETGFFSKTELTPDPKVEKEIEEFIGKRIDQAIEDGLLPRQTKKLLTKVKQNVRRNIREKN